MIVIYRFVFKFNVVLSLKAEFTQTMINPIFLLQPTLRLFCIYKDGLRFPEKLITWCNEWYGMKGVCVLLIFNTAILALFPLNILLHLLLIYLSGVFCLYRVLQMDFHLQYS